MNSAVNPLTLTDFYKVDHRSQYPEGTEFVAANFTPRKSRIEGVETMTLFGQSYLIQEYLIKQWNDNFFDRDADEVVGEYMRRVRNAGIEIGYDHIYDLHELGYLPLAMMSLPEGSRVPIGVPALVMWNTHPDFYWITNFFETLISTVLWGACNSATIASVYRNILNEAAEVSGGDLDFVPWQGHDFSMRGMFGVEAAMISGAAHLLSFTGTDSIPAIDFLETYYEADSDKELVGGSVAATEHSVMSMGMKESERETYRRLLTEVYPNGIVAIVSDTWDYWKVLTETIPSLKDEIMARDGVFTVRPDSGDPVKILVGDPDAPEGSPEHKGTFQLLWDTFGGTVNDKGFKLIDSHVNAIYGDSITMERARDICNGLIEKGFVPKMVLGIGSYTYQFNTRDTLGIAVKATYGIVNGESREIFKDPATDDGTKKSAKGLLAVYEEGGTFVLKEQVTMAEVESCAFEYIFEDGEQINKPRLDTIRQRML